MTTTLQIFNWATIAACVAVWICIFRRAKKQIKRLKDENDSQLRELIIVKDDLRNSQRRENQWQECAKAETRKQYFIHTARLGTLGVFARHFDTGLVYLIKAFPYNPDDEGNYQFQNREAEELLDKLNQTYKP